jgi:hypothetical protein
MRTRLHPVRRPARALVVGLLLALCAGCASKPPPPKPLTEADLRKNWTPDQTEQVIQSVANPDVRQVLDRFFHERARDAARHGLKFAVDSIMVGEDMGIGGGMSMKRLFALYEEYDDDHFASYLAAFETIGGRLQSEYHRQVGGSKIGIVKLEFTELNRIILTMYTFAPGDTPCCPTRKGQTGFQLGPTSLEPLE